jgi:hypothetical protein
MKYILFLLLPGVLISACETMISDNPPASGFNKSGSDEKAILIADQVMEAMGGRKAWDQTRYIEWNFFGARKLIWDKKKGRVRIDYHHEDQQAVINIHTHEGQVRKDGELITQPDSLSKYLDRAYRTWINDSYWLVMPYKLKDSGVTLKYLGEDTTQNGNQAFKLQLTFKDVGVTPQNKYYVWVDPDSHLVTQWAYFRESSMEDPNFITSWDDYKKYGKILLSGVRGDRQMSDIAVTDQVPENTFAL